MAASYTKITRPDGRPDIVPAEPAVLVPATEAAAPPPEMTDAEKLAYGLKLHEGKCVGAWIWKDGEMTDRVRCATCGREWTPSKNPNLAGRPQPRKEQAE